MQKANRLIYLLINIIWAASIILSVLMTIGGIKTLTHILNVSLSLFIASFQIYGGIKLLKGNLLIPIVAAAFFLINIDLEGLKYICTTLGYFLIGIENGELVIDGQLFNNPTILINLSLSAFTFNSISFNLFTSAQIGLLLFEYEKQKGLE